MKPLIHFVCLALTVIGFTGCSTFESSDDYLPEDSIKVYKKRDSLLKALEPKIVDLLTQKGTVVWKGEDDCKYLIIKTPKWYIVAENNYSEVVYEADELKADFPEYGNSEVYNITGESKLNLFIVNHYTLQSSAIQYIKTKCKVDDSRNY